MRWLIALFLIICLDLYVFPAFRQAIQPLPAIWKKTLTLAYWAIPLFAIGLFVFEAIVPANNLALASLAFSKAFVVSLYIPKLLSLPLLLIDDLRRLVLWAKEQWKAGQPYDRSRSQFLSTAGILMGGIPFVALLYGMIRNPYRYKVFKAKIPIHDLPPSLEGLRLVQISDIHTGSFTFKEPVKASVDLINSLHPDLVFFTGDLVNDRTSEAVDYIEVFNKIKSKYGTFSVLGNHDYGDYVEWPNSAAKKANQEHMFDVHRQLGWQLLNNEHRIVEVGGEKIAVIGVENFSAKARFPKYGDLTKACKACDPEAVVRILLSHDPSHWEYEVLSDFPDIDLTLSGHTHGMQFGIEVPGWIKWSPIKYIYKQWAGLYQKGNQFLYVNRGLGFIGYPGRVGILPEITLLELSSIKKT